LRRRDRAAGTHARPGRQRAHCRVRSVEEPADQQPRAPAREEPVRARLHPRARVEPGKGARPLPRGRDPPRHQDRRRRIRHLPGAHGCRCAARGPDVLLASQSHGAHAAAVGPDGDRLEMTPRIVDGGRLQALILCALCLCGYVPGTYAQAPNWPSEFPPRPLAARTVNFPSYQIQTLPNGLQVIAVLHHEQPAVSIRLLVRAGSAADPKGKTGLAHVTASLLDQGTATQSASQFNDAIDFIGGSVNTGAGSDLTYANMVVMKDSFDS